MSITNTEASIYRDIAQRTGGDIYIGVVGPVRTGKSTFIKRFMETLVMPNIKKDYDRTRARDEMPQSAGGKTVMTTEPKFIPDESVEVTIADNATMQVKMIDCVGYIVPDALGTIENGTPRMVITPWSKNPLPFEEAAEMGTKKVITDHSTIGIVVTTDGTIGEIPRESYVSAEERVVDELKRIGKPYAIVLNSAEPARDSTVKLGLELEEKYGAPVALVNCLELSGDDIKNILELILLEFPVREITVGLPRWTAALEENHWLMQSVREAVLECAAQVKKTGDIKDKFASLAENENIKETKTAHIDLGSGRAEIDVAFEDDMYYRIMSELTGFEIRGEDELISLMRRLSVIKAKYDKVASALEEVNEKGYGIVTPDIDDLKLEEPEIIRENGSYGVRLKASAASIHMIRANIDTEVNPIVGTEAQSEELARSLLHEFEEDPKKIWESNIFGKTLHELVAEGLHSKLEHIPEESRLKLSDTLQRIINEGSGGLICIIL